MYSYLVLGASGMAGHLIAQYLQERGNKITAVSRRRPQPELEWISLDVRNENGLIGLIREGNYDAIINCTGILNQFAEEHKAEATYVNSYLPHLLAYTTREHSTRVIHLSTDCVFSGSLGGYCERSNTDGTSFYDRSKALGELDDNKNLTFRSSLIGPDTHKDGIGLLNWFMQQNGSIKGYDRVIWNGVTTITMAKAIERAMQVKLTGLFHLVPPQLISKFELLQKLNDCLRLGKVVIHRDLVHITNKTLVCTRTDFDFVIPDYDTMIQAIYTWIMQHSYLYNHYVSALPLA